VLQRPSGASPAVQQHTIGVYYDHRSRPFLITDHDDTGNHQSNTGLYYDQQDRLIGRIIVPLIGAPTTYTMESFVQIDPLITGTERWPSVSGVSGTETFYYTVNGQEGLPVGMYSFSRTGSPPTTADDWRADYGAFGNIRATSGPETLPSPWRFAGQIELAGTAAIVWNGATQLQLREPIVLNRWRAYYPHVGVYLSPDQNMLGGLNWTENPYGYSLLAPMDFIDPTGRQFEEAILVCVAQPELCVLAGAALAVWWYTQTHPVPLGPDFGGWDTRHDPDDVACDGQGNSSDSSGDGNPYRRPATADGRPTINNPVPPASSDRCTCSNCTGTRLYACVYACPSGPLTCDCPAPLGCPGSESPGLLESACRCAGI
jgi:RHS repeat-associated protein